MAKMKIGFVSLGCSKNQIDTEMMLAHLDDAKFQITGDAGKADVVIVNTCGFIWDAKQESIDTIREMAALRQTGRLKKLIVTGCLAERYREKLIEEMPEIDAVIGIGNVHAIVDAVQKTLKSDEKYYSFLKYEECSLDGARMLTTDAFSVFLRVSEGCNSRCSYCAIPSIRGKYRSRTMENIIEEAQDLEAAGAKELNLIAQDTSCYGIDLYGRPMLAELLRRLTKETTIPWIRLFYCYPDKINDELIAEMRDNPRILHYIDIPVQHINDTVLKRMNRRGGRALIEETVAKLRQAMPDVVIRTTAIVGFPGETREQFDELVGAVKTIRFNRFGAFAYSREEGTPAYDFPDQIDEDEKTDRLDEVMEAQAEVSLAYQKACVGKTYDVLCEGFDAEQDMYVGRNYANGPDVDGKVYFSCDRDLKKGDFVSVKINDADDYDLFGAALSA